MTTKVVGAKKAKVVKKVDQKKQVVAPVKVDKPVGVEKICDYCGKEFTSIYSGAKYCATCAAQKKRERRKGASKRRIQNRKNELQTLREMKSKISDVLATFDGCTVKVSKIQNIIYGDAAANADDIIIIEGRVDASNVVNKKELAPIIREGERKKAARKAAKK